MVRIVGRDDLKDMKGYLGAQFRAVSLTFLHSEFIAASSGPRGAEALETFYRLASKLRAKEWEFNRRARPSGAPSVMTHLREGDHSQVLRAFHTAREALLDINPAIGGAIARLTQRDIEAAARAVSPSVRTAPSA